MLKWDFDQKWARLSFIALEPALVSSLCKHGLFLWCFETGECRESLYKAAQISCCFHPSIPPSLSFQYLGKKWHNPRAVWLLAGKSYFTIILHKIPFNSCVGVGEGTTSLILVMNLWAIKMNCFNNYEADYVPIVWIYLLNCITTKQHDA